jgi:hypothetical protein
LPVQTRPTLSPVQTCRTLPTIRHRTGHLLALVPRALASAPTFQSHATILTLDRHSPLAIAKAVSVARPWLAATSSERTRSSEQCFYSGSTGSGNWSRRSHRSGPTCRSPDFPRRLRPCHISSAILPWQVGQVLDIRSRDSPQRRCRRGSGELYSPYTLSLLVKFRLHRDRGMSTSFVVRRCSDF